MEKRISSHKLKKIVKNNYGPIQNFSSGNLFTPLTSSSKIYNEFYSAISNAKKSINMEFFIFQADDTGKTFADLLCKKAKEGLKVNVILDFIGSFPYGDRARIYNKMIAEGVNLRYSLSFSDIIRSLFHKGKFFTRSGVRLFFRRNHRKILVVDGEIAFTGGANIGKEYFLPTSSNEKTWHDFQFKIRGPAVNSLQFAFFKTWIGDGGPIDIKNLHLFFRQQKHSKNGVYLNVLTNTLGRPDKLLQPILRDIKFAKKYIYVENPYILNPTIINALCKASRRGINVVVLTSLEKQDYRFLRILIERVLMILNKARVKVFIYPKTLLHGKAILIDDKIAIVGSANLNNRSFLWDYELNLEVFDRKTLVELKKNLFEKDLAISERFTKIRGTFLSKIRYFYLRLFEGFS